MRTVADRQGDTWICLELPEEHGTETDTQVSIECNSGAERVIVRAPRGWDDQWSDDELIGAISAATPTSSSP